MINVLVLNSDMDGVGYHRLFANFTVNEPDINIDIRLLNDWTLKLYDPNFILNYNIIVYNKFINHKSDDYENLFYTMCKNNGIKIVYDIDDYYILERQHPNYEKWKKGNLQKKIEDCIKKADYVTTTTSIYADKLKELNSNIVVIPNAINFIEQQWKSLKKESEKLRFLWGGGISHKIDLSMLRNDFKKFDDEFLKECQMILCGFDTRIKKDDGSYMRDITSKGEWNTFEDIFTYNKKYIGNKSYLEHLNKTDNFVIDINYGYSEIFKDEFYQRRYTKPIYTYGTMYNECDISIAPLKSGYIFNEYKSQLKVIEAGAHHCPIILSDFASYTIDDIEGKKDGKQKGFYVDKSNDTWYSKMKWYSKNRNAVKDHGENNYEHVKKYYSADAVNKTRCEFYRNII